MEQFFKSIIDMDIAPIVVCSLEHKIIYMNPAAAESYKKAAAMDLSVNLSLTVIIMIRCVKLKALLNGSMKAAAITVFLHFTIGSRIKMFI